MTCLYLSIHTAVCICHTRFYDKETSSHNNNDDDNNDDM